MCVWTGQTWSRLACCNFKLHELLNLLLLLLLLPHLLFNVSFAKAAIKKQKKQLQCQKEKKEREKEEKKIFALSLNNFNLRNYA